MTTSQVCFTMMIGLVGERYSIRSMRSSDAVRCVEGVGCRRIEVGVVEVSTGFSPEPGDQVFVQVGSKPPIGFERRVAVERTGSQRIVRMWDVWWEGESPNQRPVDDGFALMIVRRSEA